MMRPYLMIRGSRGLFHKTMEGSSMATTTPYRMEDNMDTMSLMRPLSQLPKVGRCLLAHEVVVSLTYLNLWLLSQL